MSILSPTTLICVDATQTPKTQQQAYPLPEEDRGEGNHGNSCPGALTRCLSERQGFISLLFVKRGSGGGGDYTQPVTLHLLMTEITGLFIWAFNSPIRIETIICDIHLKTYVT